MTKAQGPMPKEFPNLNAQDGSAFKYSHHGVAARSGSWRIRWHGNLGNGICLRLGPWVLVIFLAGCAIGPNYKRPPVSAPPNFRSASAVATTNSLADLPWWQL